ncbi:MAG: HAD hydrolase-like protein [Candidatus Acinetobacter avistercoris]|uniref:HAD hydrolase-like protein n=1 Tax=Acinetobacter sp. KS-LM10 TaxID=3120518 RepID=UPI001FA0F1BF|nr:HAD hydrolase-like protein [Candidatus Acinetobacter avistercoris]
MSYLENKPIIMFDMDGTLLDLAYDDLIWNQKLPERHAMTHACTLEQSHAALNCFYEEHKHTLAWYSSSFWSSKVGVDTLALQYDYKKNIQPRLGCFELLEALKHQGYRCWIVTNADCAGLKLKLENVNLSPYFEVMVSSEEIGYAKEFIEFWQILHNKHPFDPKNVMLIDDTAKVLKGAASFGIENLITITQPSSNKAARNALELEYPAINNLTELLDILNQQSQLTQHSQKEMNVKTA